MSWAHSKKFRWQTRAMFVHLCRQEKKWREKVEAKVKTFTVEELALYAAERGLTVSPSAAAPKKVRAKKRLPTTDRILTWEEDLW